MRRALLLLLACCATPALAASYPMAGSWFGSGQPDDKSEMYIDTFLPGGAFHNQHRWCRQGKATDIAETGHWAVSGDILTIAIATSNGQARPRTDHYRLIAVDGRTQNYVVLPSNFPYKAHKVAATFAMPSCDLTS